MAESKGQSVDRILRSIQNMIHEGSITSGSKMPSERVLAENLSTTRGYVRIALQRLEHYGVLTIIPQKGIYVSQIKSITLDAIINNILRFKDHEIEDLMETRKPLEIEAARLAAIRGSDEDIAGIVDAHEAFETAYHEGHPTLEEDHLFHLAIAKAAKNTVLESLITLITPEIIAMNKDFVEEYEIVKKHSLNEHLAIVQAIEQKDPEKAAEAMRCHMNNSRDRRVGSAPLTEPVT
ncbi:MAG: FadR family transcriptional regulator [Sphaerochaetaceae bacterium]|nr:FadR family transcriptional regulator [Sphaerochaetaceae bacterium]